MKLSVAAVQMVSKNNDYDGNRVRAEAHIVEAAEKGARLISLPEFALAGYVYDDSIWSQAEPLEGRTFQWLRRLCHRLDVYIGTCILERAGEDFFDTFILCGPGGQLWSHRKVEPAAYEAHFFKGGGANPSTFQTPLGHIGIAICFDTSKTYTINYLRRNRPDLLLLQFSCPALPAFAPHKDRANWIDTYRRVPALYARHLRVPVITCNKTGVFSTALPLGLGLSYRSQFVDHTSIVDGDGETLGSLSGRPGVVCAEVQMGPAGPIDEKAAARGRWFLPYSGFTRFSTELSQALGKVRYQISGKRRHAAR